MSLTAWILLGAVLVLDTGSHLLLKAASSSARGADGPAFILAMVRQPLVWLAVVAFIALFLAWIGFISLVPLSQGVMAGCITIVGVMVGGRMFFGEKITVARLSAISLITLGVLLVGLGA
ncbi:MAG: hypothetical protein R3D68_03490 [Hyphomicrobiaceae bacterium]